MKRRRARIILLGVLAAAVAGILLLAWHRLDRPPPDTSRPETAVADDVPRPAATPESMPEAPAALAAPPDADALQALATRARAGDGPAACELAYQLLGCQHRLADSRDISLAIMAERERAHEEKGDFAAANRMAEEQARRIASARFCRTIPADLRDEGSRYLRAAALAGEPSALLAYSQGHQFNPSGRGMAADPTFEAWREEAPAMLHRAFQAGEPGSVFLLSLAYADDLGIPSSLIPDDPYRAAVYHLVWARMFRAREQGAWLDKVPADQLVSARREAERLHADVFRGQHYESREVYLPPPSLKLPGYSRTPCRKPQ